MQRAVIICASPEHIPLNKIPKPLKITDDDFIIACDGGLNYAQNENLKVDVCIGDFDSYIGCLDESLNIIRHKKEKDDTDTMLAIKYAFEKGIKNILLLGATGGRFDHTVATIQSALWIAKNGGQCVILDDKSQMHTITNKNSPFYLEKQQPNKNSIDFNNVNLFSIFSLTDKSWGVNEKGVKYELKDAEISSTFPIGISNEIMNNQAEISVKEGVLLLIAFAN